MFGEDLRAAEITGLDLRLFYQTFQQFEKSNIEFFTASDFMDKLAGTDKLRKAMLAGEPLENIRASWQAGLAQYIVKRKPYLLYPEKG